MIYSMAIGPGGAIQSGMGRIVVLADDWPICSDVPFEIANEPTAEGDMQWQQTYGGSDFDGINSVIQTADGGFALAGYTYSYGAGGMDVWLVRTDARGVPQWQQTYGGSHYDYANAVIKTADGGFALAGCTESFGPGKYYYYNAWLVKTDADGNVEWQQTYGGSDWDGANSVIETADGGFALAGITASYGAGGYDAWLVKTIPPETTPPELSAPEDLAFEEETTGHVITWVVGDRCPGTYAIYTDSGRVDSDTWTNGTITWNVDGLALGTYNVTLFVWDAAHNGVSDTVWVTVMAPETPPETLLLPELLVIRTMVLLSLVTLITLGVRRKYHRKLLEGH